MRRLGPLVGLIALTCLMPLSATGADIIKIVPMLKQGGYVLVLRHGATDDSQKDVYPFVFDDMKKQRQLSDQGRKSRVKWELPLKHWEFQLGKFIQVSSTGQLKRAP